MTNFQTTEINLSGFRFNALVAGAADGDLVLFLHGFPEFGDAWRDVMQPIAEAGFRAVAVDQRGYSRGARPTDASDYRIEHRLSDVRGFGDALGRRRFHLVGHDWGAFLAWFPPQPPPRIFQAASIPWMCDLIAENKLQKDAAEGARHTPLWSLQVFPLDPRLVPLKRRKQPLRLEHAEAYTVDKQGLDNGGRLPPSPGMRAPDTACRSA